MNILVLTMNIGGNAPGIVFERLLHGLSNIHKIDVLTVLDEKSAEICNINSIISISYFEIQEYRKSQLRLILGINPFDLLWAYKAKKKINESVNYDIVLSFISNEHYASLIAGVEISKYLNVKFVVYSVDALPAPLGWSVDNLYFRSCKKFISKYLSKVDVFFAANTLMLDYQKSLINKVDVLYDVIYNPSPLDQCIFNESKSHIFLYTGEIYNVRRVTYFISALKKILKEYPDVELHFVGSNIPDSDLIILNEYERQAVKIFPRVQNLNPFYEKAFCLIDIDADLKNDVYLSSKMTNYIMINRPIICETSGNSPSRNIFKGIPSILQCDHNPDEIYQSMKNLIENPITIFKDRAKVIELFKLENIVTKLNMRLEEIKMKN